MDLNDARVVVVGGSSGMGLATAAAALAQGAQVTIVGRSRDKLDAALAVLPGARAVLADISREKSAAKIFRHLDRLDHLYISAGTHHHSHVIDNSLAELHAVVNERLWGVVHVVRAARGLMSQGSITFTTGNYSTRPRAGGALQSAALAAVEALVPALALELAPVRVNAICAGTVETPLLDTIYGAAKAAHLKTRAAALPVGKVGNVDEIAQAVLMIMTNGYINAAVLNIDGGGRYAATR